MSMPKQTTEVKTSRPSLAGSLRVIVFLSCLLALLGCWSLRGALAQAELAARRLGDSLQTELGPALIGEPETLSINGQLLRVASRSTELSVHEVLERFSAHCTSAVDPKAALMLPADLLASSPAAPPATPKSTRRDKRFFEQLLDVSSQLGVLRTERESEGHLACFARPAARANLAALAEDLGALVDTGDFARMGKLRYVTARAQPNGKTHLVVVWSEGPLRLGALFPETGDAQGSDMEDVPRPAGTRRELCALAVGRSYGLRLYRAQEAPAALLAFYDRELPRKGWQSVTLLSAGGNLGRGLFARAFVRDGRALALGIQAELGSDASSISLVDLGGVEHVTAQRSASLVP